MTIMLTALEMKNGDKTCLVIRAKCYLMLGNSEQALIDANAALEQDEDGKRDIRIFAYMYTSDMALTDELLEPVINAAIVMGVQEVVDVVKGILSSPTMDNINLYNGIIKRVGLDISLLDQEKIYRFGFSDLRHNSVYLGISVDELEGILMDPEVMVTNEVETVEMIISWIQYNFLQRIGCLDLLLRYVSFGCIPPEDLVMLSEKYSHIFDTNAGSNFLCQAFKCRQIHTA